MRSSTYMENKYGKQPHHNQKTPQNPNETPTYLSMNRRKFVTWSGLFIPGSFNTTIITLELTAAGYSIWIITIMGLQPLIFTRQLRPYGLYTSSTSYPKSHNLVYL